MLAAGLAIGLAACSNPAPSTDKTAKATDRDLELIQSPSADTASVSDLEAGRVPLRSRPNRPIERRLAEVVAPPPAPTEPVVQTMVTGGPAAEPATDLAAGSPAAPPQEEVVEVKDRGVLMSIPTPGDDDPGLGSSSLGSMARRPGILIRGGRGGIDDDCDLDRPGAHGNHGTAINRIAPTPGNQFGSETSRVGGRSGGMSGFPRRGIR